MNICLHFKDAKGKYGAGHVLVLFENAVVGTTVVVVDIQNQVEQGVPHGAGNEAHPEQEINGDNGAGMDAPMATTGAEGNALGDIPGKADGRLCTVNISRQHEDGSKVD